LKKQVESSESWNGGLKEQQVHFCHGVSERLHKPLEPGLVFILNQSINNKKQEVINNTSM
jgi:hypothetical protein